MRWVWVVGVAVAAGFLSGCASENSRVPFPAANTPGIPDSTTAAIVPPGFISFCVRFADQCREAPGASQSVSLTAQTWQTMQQVNASVNDAIWPEEDEKHYGREEYWTIPTDGYGDCEDFALTKRKQLMAAGFPEPSLRIAVVDTPQQARHAVLTVVTDKGDFVLDNLQSGVAPWNSLGYRWIERQDPKRPLGWVSLEDAGAPAPIVTASTPTTDQVSAPQR